MDLSNPINSRKKLFNIRAEKLYREACDLFYLKNYEKSLSLLNEITLIDKTHSKAFLLTGDIKLLNEGNEAEALDAYDAETGAGYYKVEGNSIKFLSLVLACRNKTYKKFWRNSRLDELAQTCFNRFRWISSFFFIKFKKNHRRWR